jgi:hypothetical protein
MTKMQHNFVFLQVENGKSLALAFAKDFGDTV